MVVLPPLTETVRSETMKLLEEYAAAGGQILSCGPPPSLVDGRPSDRGAKLAQGAGWKQIEAADAAKQILPALDRDRCVIRRAEDDKGNLFHQRRQLADGELLLLVNTSIESPSQGTVETLAKESNSGICFRARWSRTRYVTRNRKHRLPYDLPPCGSLLLFLGKGPDGVRRSAPTYPVSSQPAGPSRFTLLVPTS